MYATLAPTERPLLRSTTAEPMLNPLGWALAALVVPLGLAAATNAHLVPDGTENPWVKPIKFAVSLATLLWTLPFLMRGLRISAKERARVRTAASLGAVAELAFVVVQAGRTVHRVGPATAFDRTLVQGASISILVVCGACIALTLRYFDDRRVRLADGPMLMAIRHGLVVFLVGSAIGGYILSRGSAAMGHDGDLRVAHFIALHAIQVLPLAAWAIAQFRPDLSPAQRVRAVRCTTAGISLAVAATFALALLGQPLIP